MIRFFDFIFSLIGLIIISPIFLIIVLLIKLESKGSAFYKQIRVGKENNDFKLYKFRSMHLDSDKKGLITVGGRDPRITRIGYFIRKYKLDELPQLINVLKGEMSLVGPRPEVRKYVDLYSPEQMIVLSVKPGITDSASIEFSNENEILGESLDPEKTYIQDIMPQKIKLNKKFIENKNFKLYFKIILLTFIKILRINTMKEKLFYIKNNYQYLIFLLVAFCLPITFQYQPLLVGILGLSGILAIRKSNFNASALNLLLLFPLLYFVLQLLGILYSNDTREAWVNIETKIAIVFISILTLFLTKNVKLKIEAILKIFVWANLLASLICLFFALKNSISFDDLGNIVIEISDYSNRYSFFQLINMRQGNFSYTFLSSIHHPAYFSMYIIFSIVILLYLINQNKTKYKYYIFMILYFIAFIYLLASRAGYITLVVIFFIHFIYRLKQGASRIIIVSTFVVLVIGLTFFVSFNRRIHKNIIEIENIALGNFTLNKKSDIRLWLWKAGLETIKENPWGIGTGDAKKVLDKKYETYNLKKLQGKHLNSHNQFIDEGVKLGYMGIIFMFSWMFYALYYATRRKNYLFFNFILILFINMFFEVILVRIAGVSFFVLFYSLLLIKNERISSH